MSLGFGKFRESNKEDLKTCGNKLIHHVIQEFKEQNKLRTYVTEVCTHTHTLINER